MTVATADQLDIQLMRLAFPANTTNDLLLWIEPLRAACKKWGIDTVRELASFLANIAVESQDLTKLEENLNYSVDGLLKTFGRHRISADQAKAYGRTPTRRADQEKLANILYGGEWGRENLGNTMPGDGWKFRGCGMKQITGRDNFERCAKALGVRLDDMPAYLRTREGSAQAAGWFWKSHGLDAKAATPGVEDDRRAINGGVLGIEVVEPRFNLLVKELLKRGL